MMTGSVNADGEAFVSLRVRGPGGTATVVDALIDTGFDAWLTLPRKTIEALALPPREKGRYTLGDGSQASSLFSTAEVEWFNGWRRVLIVELDTSPMIGMAMLKGCHLGIDVLPGGSVEIRYLGV